MGGRVIGRRALLAVAAALPAFGVREQGANQGTGEPIKVGVLCDMSGAYMDATGSGLVLGARMAIEDFGGAVLGRPVTAIGADDQNKPDVGSAIARRWMDEEGFSAIVEGSASSIALSVAEMARARGKMLLIAASTSADLTGRFCSPTAFQCGMHTFCGRNAAVRTAIADGADTWYILNVDYAFGLSLKAEATRIIQGAGAKLLGATGFPLGTADFSSQLLQAQASGAKAIALACGGTDWTNIVKQSHEFGLTGGKQRLVTFLTGLNEVGAAGLAAAGGTEIAQVFYWDQDEKTRAFTARFRPRHKGTYPNWQQASAYSATLHWLKAVKTANTTEARVVAEAMHATPVDDFALHGVPIRADGQVMRPMYIMKVKQPGEPKGVDDLLTVVKAVPGEEVWRPAAESACPALRRT